MPPTVLVACDSSGGDRSPTAFARALAPLLGARVSLVHVRDADAPRLRRVLTCAYGVRPRRRPGCRN
jgi:hypothetical protein